MSTRYRWTPDMGPVAVLAGTDRTPEIHLLFERGAVHAKNGSDLVEWVKKAPRRYWDGKGGHWTITAFGGSGYEVKVQGGGGAPVIAHDAKPKNPERLLTSAGFRIVYDPTDIGGPPLDPSLETVLSLDELVEPLCRQSNVKPVLALVRPRFAGWDVARAVLGPSARWDKQTQRFEVPLTDLIVHGNPKKYLAVDKATVEAARNMLLAKPKFGSDKHDDETLMRDAAVLGSSTGLDLSDADEASVARLVETVGDIPDWFGLALYPYQRLGAIACVSGRGLNCDPPGLGKTRQILAAFANREVDRAVLIVPPVVLTNWAREAEQSALAVIPPPPPKKKPVRKAAKKAVAALRGRGSAETALPVAASKGEAASDSSVSLSRIAPPTSASEVDPDGAHATQQQEGGAAGSSEAIAPRHIVMFKAGRKEPDLPERGLVIVPDSLLSGRPELRARIAAWSPDAIAYDEIHRIRNWESKRTQSILDFVYRMRPDCLRIGATGTPLFANPAELVPLLAFTGHLDPVFGGAEKFISRYCKRNFFNALVANPDTLDELREILYARVWVRRDKKEVLKDLPPKARYGKYVDVDLSGFRAAHDEVIEKIMAWLDEFLLDSEANPTGDYPSDEIIKVYARQQIGLMSPLRKAAGLAKVPIVFDLIKDWIDSEVTFKSDGTFVCDRPLLLWAHHQEVVQAMVEAAKEALRTSDKSLVGVIDGGTSADNRGRLVDQFQAGQLPILICSISAAGVGITLTRGSDAVFVETSPSLPEVSQAEDRQSRIGQTSPTSNTTLLAEGTFDEHLQRILVRKAEIVDAVTGDKNGVAVMTAEEAENAISPAAIIETLVHAAIERHEKETKAGKRAA